MKRIGIYLAAFALCAGSLIILRRTTGSLTVLDFKWTIDGREARLGFIVRNRTNHPVVCTIAITATNVRESRVGTGIAPIGFLRMPITLAAHEEKNVHRVLHLSADANSETVITYSLDRTPNQALSSNTLDHR